MPSQKYICFEVNEPLRNYWSKPKHVHTESDYELLGIQFCLKKKTSTTDWDFRSEVKVRQVYANSNNSSLIVDDATNAICKQNSLIFEMEDEGSLNDYHLTENASLLTENRIFEKLQYFDENTAYIYFNIDQIRFLIAHYDKIYLSGCQIDFGKKPSNITPGSEHLNGPAFSLKLEGKEPEGISSRQDNTDTSENLDEIAGVFVGAPCPPLWYAWSNLAVTLRESDQIQPSNLDNLKLQFAKTMDLTRPLP